MPNHESAEIHLSFADRLARVCQLIAVGALIIVAFVQLWQVFSRYVLNQSPAWTEPLSSLFLLTLMSFASANSVHQRSHFRFSWLADKLSLAQQRWLEFGASMLLTLVAFVLCAKALGMALTERGVQQTGVALSLSFWYWLPAIAFALSALFALLQGYTRIRSEAN
jgi:TRAP-type C4-dicarboxylate transport system permease small subunit